MFFRRFLTEYFLYNSEYEESLNAKDPWKFLIEQSQGLMPLFTKLLPLLSSNKESFCRFLQLTAFEAFMLTDEATNEAAAAVRKKQKRSSGSQVESKMEALMRAEEAFTARQGTRQLNVILA